MGIGFAGCAQMKSAHSFEHGPVGCRDEEGARGAVAGSDGDD